MKNNLTVEKYKDYLGNYGEQLYDSWSGEPIMWGYAILGRMDEEKFQELRKDANEIAATLECVYPNWYLITKKLTRKEAEEKYGKITEEEFGPRGGWKSVTFGDKKFGSKILRKDL